MEKILVVVDVQHDFVDGILGSKEAQAAIPNITKKVNEYANMEDLLDIFFSGCIGLTYMPDTILKNMKMTTKNL